MAARQEHGQEDNKDDPARLQMEGPEFLRLGPARGQVGNHDQVSLDQRAIPQSRSHPAVAQAVHGCQKLRKIYCGTRPRGIGTPPLANMISTEIF